MSGFESQAAHQNYLAGKVMGKHSMKLPAKLSKRRLLFSVTMKDLEMQTFSVSGHGGGGKDTSNSGVRLIHRESGAVGEGREHRSNTQNRKSAFLKLANSPKFQAWHKWKCAQLMARAVEPSIDDYIRNGIDEKDLKIEYYTP